MSLRLEGPSPSPGSGEHRPDTARRLHALTAADLLLREYEKLALDERDAKNAALLVLSHSDPDVRDLAGAAPRPHSGEREPGSAGRLAETLKYLETQFSPVRQGTTVYFLPAVARRATPYLRLDVLGSLLRLADELELGPYRAPEILRTMDGFGPRESFEWEKTACVEHVHIDSNAGNIFVSFKQLPLGRSGISETDRARRWRELRIAIEAVKLKLLSAIGQIGRYLHAAGFPRYVLRFNTDEALYERLGKIERNVTRAVSGGVVTVDRYDEWQAVWRELFELKLSPMRWIPTEMGFVTHPIGSPDAHLSRMPGWQKAALPLYAALTGRVKEQATPTTYEDMVQEIAARNSPTLEWGLRFSEALREAARLAEADADVARFYSELGSVAVNQLDAACIQISVQCEEDARHAFFRFVRWLRKDVDTAWRLITPNPIE